MKVCYPGSFDPITKGHLDIIVRSSRIFDEVVVLLMDNPHKKYTFTVEERVEYIRKAVSRFDNVKVEVGSGLTVDYAAKIHAGGIIRGLRGESDYDYELQMATANLTLNSHIETIVLFARPQFNFLSSSVLKDITRCGGDVEDLLPAEIAEEVQKELLIRTAPGH